jgi:hypothetical protein
MLFKSLKARANRIIQPQFKEYGGTKDWQKICHKMGSISLNEPNLNLITDIVTPMTKKITIVWDLTPFIAAS